MVDARLLDYIKKELAAGYKPEAIRAYLMNYGYNPADVDEAMRIAVQPAAPAPAQITPTPTAPAAPAAGKKIPIIPIAIGFVAVALIVVVVLIFFTGREERAVVTVVKAPKLDLKTSMISSNLRQGNDINFNLIMNSLDGKAHDVGLTYDIINSDGIKISQEEDFIEVDTKVFEEKIIELPEDINPGQYSLVVTARYDGEDKKSTLRFGVLGAGAEIEEEVVEFSEVQCPSSCDDGNVCTDDQCSAATGYECVHFPQIPCCGNLNCEEFEDSGNCPTDCSPSAPAGVVPELTLPEIISNVKTIAATNLGEAESYCNSLADKNQKDSCFFQIAQTSKQSKYCVPINSELKRDNCYSDFALNGDFSVCSQMTNVYMKESCFELEEASQSTSLR